jgi:hypothetical protein
VNFNTVASRVVCCKRYNAFRLALNAFAPSRGKNDAVSNAVLTWTHVPGYFPPTGEPFLLFFLMISS